MKKRCKHLRKNSNREDVYERYDHQQEGIQEWSYALEMQISNDSISKMLNSIAAKTIIVFLDSCYSAATVKRGWHTRSLIEKDPFEEFKGEGRVVITTSNGKQQSLEIQEYRHGVFYLVQNTIKLCGIHQAPIIVGRHSAGILLSKCPKE